MRRFLARLGFLAGMMMATILGVDYHDAALDSSFLIGDQYKDSLLRSTAAPRVVLTGGSNVAFGIDSREIARRTGVQVINAGLHAGLGLHYILTELKPHLRPGDLVIIIPEYEQFFSDFWLGDETLDVTLSYWPHFRLPLIGQFRRFGPYVRATVERFRRALARMTPTGAILGDGDVADPVYNRWAFNDVGDVISHLDRAPTFDSAQPRRLMKVREFNASPVKALLEFERFSRNRGARVLLTFPPYPTTMFRSNERAIKYVEQQLQASGGASIVGTPTQFVYPPEWFFDTEYHLSALGRTHQTARLADLLAAANTGSLLAER